MDNYPAMLAHLKTKRKVLFLTTSNRWSGEKEQPKSTMLAYQLAQELGDIATVIEIPKLNIVPCEGNVSTQQGNVCGVLKAQLHDAEKNPTGHHRCWANINNPDDELWKVSKELLTSDCVVFFTSVRWGQLNVHYQKLIERLTWLENRHSTLDEENLLAGIDAGLVVVGQNWHGEEALATQKKVLFYYGFNVKDELCWNWQFTRDAEEESPDSYRQGWVAFRGQYLSR